jgi:imidazole glycerol-phosphate synthase subunit HisH
MIIGIIDYGVGNTGSVKRAVELAGADPLLISAPDDSVQCNALILPGVGNFSDCYQKLKEQHWVDFFSNQYDSNRWPLLGICVGMQLLMEYGFEGASDEHPSLGLGLIPGSVHHLARQACTQRLPHVGWNSINIQKNEEENILFQGISDKTDFYFVHSYSAVLADTSMITSYANYEIDIVASIANNKIFGTQFHPEKSSKAGLAVYRNFINTVIC